MGIRSPAQASRVLRNPEHRPRPDQSHVSPSDRPARVRRGRRDPPAAVPFAARGLDEGSRRQSVARGVDRSAAGPRVIGGMGYRICVGRNRRHHDRPGTRVGHGDPQCGSRFRVRRCGLRSAAQPSSCARRGTPPRRQSSVPGLVSQVRWRLDIRQGRRRPGRPAAGNAGIASVAPRRRPCQPQSEVARADDQALGSGDRRGSAPAHLHRPVRRLAAFRLLGPGRVERGVAQQGQCGVGACLHRHVSRAVDRLGGAIELRAVGIRRLGCLPAPEIRSWSGGADGLRVVAPARRCSRARPWELSSRWLQVDCVACIWPSPRSHSRS